MNVNARRLPLLLFSVAVFLAPHTSLAATLSLMPANASVNVGDSFTVAVRVSSSDQVMNAVSGALSFPTDLLRVASISKANSVLTLWVQDPIFSNSTGIVDWSGVVPNPGYTGSGGQIVSVIFVAKKTGTGTIAFSSSSVLANDGNGTNILTAANPASISITQAAAQPVLTLPASAVSPSADLLAQITSSTHPDQTKWYRLSHAVFDWTNAQGVTAVRLGYDKNADGVPTIPYTDPISHKELQLGDGIWYFHVQQKKGVKEWGPVSTFRIQIDTVPPAPIVLRFPNGATTATSTIAVQFTTTDELSGIDRYQVAIDGRSFDVSAQDGSGIYALTVGESGIHTLSVTAYDKAGNTVNAEQQFSALWVEKKQPPESPAWSAFVWLIANYLALILLILAALAAVLFIGWYLWHRFHTFRRRVVNKEERMHLLVHRQFNELKNAVADEITALEEIKSERDLTLEEERLINRLQKLIDQSERTIDKEIDQMLKK